MLQAADVASQAAEVRWVEVSGAPVPAYGVGCLAFGAGDVVNAELERVLAPTFVTAACLPWIEAHVT